MTNVDDEIKKEIDAIAERVENIRKIFTKKESEKNEKG